MKPTTPLFLPLAAVLTLPALLFSGCADPNKVLDVDRANIQFTRQAVVETGDVDGEEVPVYVAGPEVTKRVTISNSSTEALLLEIALEGEHPGAFIPEPPLASLPDPYNYRVDANSRLDFNIIFRGEVVGPNLARLVIRDPAVEFEQKVVLQGVVDCVSLGNDLDRDGFCTGTNGPDEDCNDIPETGGYWVNPAAAEVCDDGPQIDNDCDESALKLVDEDDDGYCDLTASCGEPAELEAACPIEDCNDSEESINPGAIEVCETVVEGDGLGQLDNDCDTSNDIDVLSEVWDDFDGDTYGDGVPEYRCGPPLPGQATRGGDCDDANAGISPVAPEVCDGLDNDCDDCSGGVPAPGAPDGTVCAPLAADEVLGDIDQDDDQRALCEFAADGVTPLDCDDTDNSVYLGHPEECDGKDNDCDGDVPEIEEDNDSDNYVECASLVDNPPYQLEADCDDEDDQINPGQPEIECDYVDNDCDGQLGEEETDADIDGQDECSGDCNDSAPTVWDGATELCDAVDNNCDGVVPLDELDHDADGYVECDEEALPWPVGYYGVVGASGGSDCNDDPSDPVSADVFPFAPEIADSYYEISGVFRLVDNQCAGNEGFDANGSPGLDVLGNDEYCYDDTQTVFCLPSDACYDCIGGELDSDGDGWSDAQGDCDDGNDLAAPGLVEVCDGIDNDCDGFIPLSEVDADGDGYVQCWPPPDVTGLQGGDCDPGDADINPGEPEIADGIDNDCDALTLDPEELDEDGDGVTGIGPDLLPGNADDDCDDGNADVYPGAPELCDQLDNDCDGDLGDGTGGDPDERDQDLDGFTICGDADCADSGTQLIDDYEDYLASISAPTTTWQGSAADADEAAFYIHPYAEEFCDGWQNDCTGETGTLFVTEEATNPDEHDGDGDLYIECTENGFDAWLENDGFANQNLSGGNDCADELGDAGPTTTPLPEIYPAAPELCDGWDNPCEGSNPPEITPLTGEWDDDGDLYIECTGFVDLGAGLLGGGDCLDQDTVHFATGLLMTTSEVGVHVNPGATEVCDGLNTDCSLPLATNSYDANDTVSPTIEEDDTDGDLHIECLGAAAWTDEVGYTEGDCLDEQQNHFQTNDAISLALAAMINPSATEVCDGFDTDCSAYASGNPPAQRDYDAEDANTTFEEDDNDLDDFIECAPTAPSLVPGFGGGDCLDEDTVNPVTGVTMLATDVAINVYPGATEACDGLDTDCSGGGEFVADDGNSTLEEDDADGDGYLECGSNVAWITDVGYDDGDCLDEVTVHFATLVSMGLPVAALVNPGATEVCDGLNTDCSAPLAGVIYDAHDSNTSFEEDDTDGDLYIECSPGASHISQVGYAIGDCLDETTAHFDTGASMTAAAVGANVHPGAAEVCDGLNTDCSSPLAATADYDANDSNTSFEEDDTDGDFYIECGSPASWIGGTGLAVGDCLDEVQNHFNTGLSISLVIAANVSPAESERCDGFNTDCSTPLASTTPYDANDTDLDGIPEGDIDGDEWAQCALTGSSVVPGFQSPDCNDGDAGVNPGEIDDFGDPLVDNDCDEIFDEEGLDAGDIIINEIHANPGAQVEEWFEIRNESAQTIQLVGWHLTDDGVDDFAIPESLLVAPGALAVMCRNFNEADDVGVPCSTTIAGNWSGFQLSNNSDEIQLVAPCTGEVAPCSAGGDLLIDEVAWLSAWDFTGNSGASQGFDPDISSNTTTANNNANNWCFSVAPWASGDAGTPGAENIDCDPDYQDNDLDGYCEIGEDINGDGDCNDTGLGEDDGSSAGCLTVATADCDCDDGDDTILPMATEFCDTVDSDCDGSLVDSFADHDSDGDPDCTDTDDDNDGMADGPDDCELGDLGWTSSGGTDYDTDGCRDAGEDLDDDNDGVADLAPDLCQTGNFFTSTGGTDYDTDGCEDATSEDLDDDNDGILDTVDDCALGDLGWTSTGGTDYDNDGCQDSGEDTDDDNDGILDGPDPNDNNPDICGDSDADTCDDCSVGTDNTGPLSDSLPDNDGLDTDLDGACDAGDNDADNDGVVVGTDPNDTDPDVCGDSDGDTCDDCIIGTDDTGPLSDSTPNNDGTDTDSDGLCNDGDPDDDNDGIADGPDTSNLNPDICTDADNDSCDDCAIGTDGFGPLADNNVANDGTDTDSDGDCNDGDNDDDNDGVNDGPDDNDLNPFVCRDLDNDSCDDCAIGVDGFGPLNDFNVANDGTDTDSDGDCNVGDSDDDNDGISDTSDSASLNPDLCQDSDGDSCDDCAIGTDGFGPLADYDTANDGTDTDSDGDCNVGDPDDDNDGVADGPDTSNLNPDICQDLDNDSCDDCAVGTDGFGPLDDFNVAADGTDTDSDGDCNVGDTDDDNDGVADGPDTSELNPDICQDLDGDSCDDCAVGTDGFGPLADFNVANDGTDTDSDGDCNVGDADDDNDGVDDGPDTSELNPDICQDLDSDTCDDCAVGTDNFGSLDDFNVANDGADFDGDGQCDAGDPDDDNDLALDENDSNDNNANVCSDTDSDTCDDCVNGTYAPANDGPDNEPDGLCDAGDPDDDNDGDPDTSDCADFDASRCATCPETPDDGIDQDCNGSDMVTCYTDGDGDGYGLTHDDSLDGDGTCDSGFSLSAGDCNDSHAGVNPAVTLPESPGANPSTNGVAACTDPDGDGFCAGGGVSGADSDCQDANEDMDSVASGYVADCDETVSAPTLPSVLATAETAVDFTDNDSNGLIDEGCFGGSELVISEYYSLGTEPDWFEVTNMAWFDVSIDGWTIHDAEASSYTATSGQISIGDQAVFCAASVTNVTCVDTNAALVLDVLDGGTSNTTTVISLTAGATSIDSVDFTGATWDNPTALTSLALTIVELDNEMPGFANPPDNGTAATWCESTAASDTWSAGTASPGADNEDCTP